MMLKCLHEASAEDVVTTPSDAFLLVLYKVGKVAWVSTGLLLHNLVGEKSLSN